MSPPQDQMDLPGDTTIIFYFLTFTENTFNLFLNFYFAFLRISIPGDPFLSPKNLKLPESKFVFLTTMLGTEYSSLLLVYPPLLTALRWGMSSFHPYHHL
jgi:hypothetical protein